MNILKRTTVPLLLAAAAVPAWSGLSAQVQGQEQVTVTGEMPTNLAGLPKGPEIDGIISARKGGQLQVTGANGSSTAVLVGQTTDIRSSGGFLGLDRNKLGANAHRSRCSAQDRAHRQRERPGGHCKCGYRRQP